MSGIIIGALVCVLGLLGLILAGGAIDNGMYHIGLALFGFALLYVFWRVKRYFDAAEAGRWRAAPSL